MAQPKTAWTTSLEKFSSLYFLLKTRVAGLRVDSVKSEVLYFHGDGLIQFGPITANLAEISILLHAQERHTSFYSVKSYSVLLLHKTYR